MYEFTDSEKELVKIIKDYFYDLDKYFIRIYTDYEFYYKNKNFILYIHIPSKHLFITTDIVNKLHLYSNNIEMCNLFTYIFNIKIIKIYTTNDIILNNYEYYKED